MLDLKARLEPTPTSPPPPALRVAYVTADEAVLDANSVFSATVEHVASVTKEVHVVFVASTTSPTKEPTTEKRGQNMWIHRLPATNWFNRSRTVRTLVAEQFSFQDSISIDLVIGRGLDDSSLVAMSLAKEMTVPLQLHFLRDLWTPTILEALSRREERVRSKTIQAAASIRCASKHIETQVVAAYPAVKSKVSVLPEFYDLSLLATKPALGFIRKRFPEYRFFIAFVGPFTEAGGVFAALDAATAVLQSPGVGMVCIGAGDQVRLRDEVAARGLSERVVIAPTEVTEADLIQEADVLLWPGGATARELLPLIAAAAGTPVVAAQAGLVADFFRHDFSALLAQPGDIKGLSNGVRSLLNDSALRKKLARNAKEEVAERVEYDEATFKAALRYSIESGLTTATEPDVTPQTATT